ncbi:hypothetical protein [Microvirga puerhi]|uniref:Cytochrome c domain-containing protein n=1 Tax=Microvirga puerhi TaxID=2876078 RepID=A0ABS7VH47_9HYPH|nr:hypothetical protein [Microvirga puerhi]MBZ6074825.1 hypothetical protein [Microvirga puerhi]
MGRLNIVSILTLLATLVGLATAQAQAPQAPTRPDQIDYAMFPLAEAKDSPQCRLHVTGDTFAFDPAVSNPSMTCPDAFAWTLFVRSVRDNFWEDWTTDRQMWPSDPWPRCRPGTAPDRCCPAIEISNTGAPEHCPAYPGPTPGVPSHQVRAPVTAHQMSMEQALGVLGKSDGRWDNVPAILKSPVIGALQDELIFRNKPMVDYVFDNELYHTEGLIRVFDNFVTALGSAAPRRPAAPNPAKSHDAPPFLTKIDFPIAALMVKANWLAADRAAQVGINPDDQEHPYIVMNFVPRSPPGDATPASPKPYLLLSMHISSKDVPNWTWATFEHVNNQGRCDWTGCNDSFGYPVQAKDTTSAGSAALASNYIGPNKTRNIDGSGVDAFDLAGAYPDGGEISPVLGALFAQGDIGTGNGINRSGRPTRQDAAWRSYRLKGTQVDFVTATGVPTKLGNSVTEAGFVNSASCLTCHSRAAITREGVPAFAIFADRMSDAGLAESVNGAPNPAWFSVNAFFGVGTQREAPQVMAVQTDFVWGFRFACPMDPRPLGPAWCKNLTTKGYSAPVPTRMMP